MKKLLILIAVFISNIALAVESDKIFKLYTNNGKDEYCATAFFVSETRVLTAAHTFKHKTFNHFILRNGKFISIKMVKIDKHADIAVLECSVEDKNNSFFELNTALPDEGSQVGAIGFKMEDKFLTDLKETVVSIGERIDCRPDGVDGMSGCPLVDSSGRAIGMLVTGWGGTSHSVKASDLKSSLER